MAKNFRLFLLAAFVLGSLLSSCGSDPAPEPEPVPGGYDTNDYPYKLNVVYLVPTDQTANLDYEERLSKMLLEFQQFTCKWMYHWGYGYRSFGLPKNADGSVQVVTVPGGDVAAGYPRNNSNAVSIKIQNEVRAYYAANNLTPHSDHYIVVLAINNKNNADTPLYGSAQWCFTTDYPNMRHENIATTSGSPVGDMMHELLHALNTHHVGPTWSQKNDPNYGTPIMGVGNWYYGKQAAFLHKASAVTLLTSQVCALTKGVTYYNWDTPEGKIFDPEVTIDGENCTVSGTFSSKLVVKHAIVRFVKSSEQFMNGSQNYDCAGFVADVTNGNNYSVTFPVSDLRAIGSTTYTMGVTILHSNGTVTNKGTSPVYTLVNNGGKYTLKSSGVNINRTDWTVTASHTLPAPSGANGDDTNVTGNLVDGNSNTCLTVVKPGMTYKGVTVPADDKVWVTIDMKKADTFNTVLLDFRLYNTHAAWRANKVSFLKSEDNEKFTLIKQATLDTAGATAQNVVDLGTDVTCRYLRMTYDDYETASGDPGGAMVFSELRLEMR